MIQTTLTEMKGFIQNIIHSNALFDCYFVVVKVKILVEKLALIRL